MKLWRMKLRAGSYGDNMWNLCRERCIASMTHPPIYETDLTYLTKAQVDPAVKGSARTSIWRFAWEIKGGDVIYVGDSVSKSIIASGFVTSEVGDRAYRYNSGDAMTEPQKPQIAWRHEVPVQWDPHFKPFRYKDRAPRYTVMPYCPPQEDDWQRQREVSPDSPSLLNEVAYMRETEASKRNISRLHASLSNQFRLWLERRFFVKVEQEQHGVDLRFTYHGGTHLAELKICYGANTRHAIREALGQLFEYNHYPPREEMQSWWLVLDHAPSESDHDYILALKRKYGIPITMSWPIDDEVFGVFPFLPFALQQGAAS